MPEPIDDYREENQPIDGAALVDPTKRFSPACLAAVREFRHQKPWRGTIPERQAKFEALHAALCECYGLVPPPPLEFVAIGQAQPEQPGTGGFDTRGNRLVVAGRLSVNSYLWAFARARGLGVDEAFRWSLSLFARMFRRSFAECRFEGPLLVRDNNQNL